MQHSIDINMTGEDKNKILPESISETFDLAIWAHMDCCAGNAFRALFWPQTLKLYQIFQVIQCFQVLWNQTNIRSVLKKGKKNGVVKHFLSELQKKKHQHGISLPFLYCTATFTRTDLFNIRPIDHLQPQK